MGDYRGRLSDSPGITHLFRRIQLVWETTWRHSLRERTSSGLHSNRVDAHCLARIKFGLLFDSQILLGRTGIPACPNLYSARSEITTDRQECLSYPYAASATPVSEYSVA